MVVGPTLYTLPDHQRIDQISYDTRSLSRTGNSVYFIFQSPAGTDLTASRCRPRNTTSSPAQHWRDAPTGDIPRIIRTYLSACPVLRNGLGDRTGKSITMQRPRANTATTAQSFTHKLVFLCETAATCLSAHKPVATQDKAAPTPAVRQTRVLNTPHTPLILPTSASNVQQPWRCCKCASRDIRHGHVTLVSGSNPQDHLP